MSYDYNYYIGYKTKEGKIYPLGPYDSFGEWHIVMSRGRDFETDLHEDFNYLSDDEASDELRKEFLDDDEYKSGRQLSKAGYYIKYLSLKDMPQGDYIRRGYFLISDVQYYEKLIEEEGYVPTNPDCFYESLSPTIYAAMLQKELILGGAGENKRDGNHHAADTNSDDHYEDDEFEAVEHKASDFMYYAYPDFRCKEYESFIIRQAAYMLDYADMPKGSEIVAIETEG